MKKKVPHLNVSIKWKLVGAFFLSVLTPVVVFEYTMNIWWALGIGSVVSTLLAIYSGYRVLDTINRLTDMVEKIGAASARDKTGRSKDELHDLLHSFDRLVSHFQERTAAAETALPTSGENSPPDNAPDELGTTRHFYHAKLATGEPARGIGVLLPRRGELESDRKRLFGQEAREAFDTASESVRERLEHLAATSSLPEDERGILEFQQMLLEDDALLDGVNRCLDDGISLSESLNTTFSLLVSRLESAGSSYLAARTHDCLDLKEQLLAALATSRQTDEVYGQLQGKIVLCQQVYPSEVIALQQAGVAGIVAATGTAASHAEILLRTYDLPSLANFGTLPSLRQLAGHELLLNTLINQLVVNPGAEDLVDPVQLSAINLTTVIPEPVTLATGEPVHVAVTINNAGIETPKAQAAGADGVGLFRTEMSYIGRRHLPDEQELTDEYRHLTDAFKDRPVVMRMLDLGGDKLPLGERQEAGENPCMGNRSMRLLLRRPDIFQVQLRAMLRSAGDDCTILFPMISGWRELLQIQRLFDEVVEQLRGEGWQREAPIKRGIMVEVPGIVTRFEDYVEHFDCFSIGTNDLTQYALAADRNNEAVADYYACHHPSILSMLDKVARIGAAHGKPVAVCGEMAADKRTLPLLVGLGLRRFSVPYSRVPNVKGLARTLDREKCEAFARKALACRSVEEVDRLMDRLHPEEVGQVPDREATSAKP